MDSWLYRPPPFSGEGRSLKATKRKPSSRFDPFSDLSGSQVVHFAALSKSRTPDLKMYADCRMKDCAEDVAARLTFHRETGSWRGLVQLASITYADTVGLCVQSELPT